MSTHKDLIERYFAIWNETDPTRRRNLIAKTWTEHANYLDPVMQGDGHAGIDAMIEGVQQRFPGHQFRRSGEVDAHHDRVRFCWELRANGGAVIVDGMDFAVIAADGRLQTVTGFLDRAPTLPQP